MCNIVFLYNYTVYILYEKTGEEYGFYCMSKQAEIDVQSTSNRKLPNFYEKVTDFLLESYRISKWWQNHVFTETCCICHKWRILTYWIMRLFMQTDWLFMRKNGLDPYEYKLLLWGGNLATWQPYYINPYAQAGKERI